MSYEEYLKRRETYRVRVYAEGVWIEGNAYKYPKDYGCTLEHAGYKLSDSRHIMFMCPKQATKQDAVKFAESHLGEMYRIINLYRTKKDQLIAELEKELDYRDEKSNCRSAMDKMREACILRVFGEDATKVQWETMRYFTSLSCQDYPIHP